MKTKTIYSYAFGILAVLLGLVFNITGVGMKEMLGFSSVGTYLVYIGFISLIIATLRLEKKKQVDERMMAAALQSSRLTFVYVILFAFVVMVFDGIRTITVAYSMFMSYFVMFVILSHLITYKLLLRYKY